MVQVTLTRLQGDPQRLRVLGHAGAGAYGEDLVCAAVSALVETLRLALEQMEFVGWSHETREGHADFRFGPDLGPRGVAIVEAICVGLKDLAASQPRFVRYGERQELGD